MKRKGSVLVGFLFVIFAALVVFGFFAGRNFFSKKAAVNSPLPTPSINDWKTYTSPDGKFSFKYPSDFTLKDSKNRINFISYENGKEASVMWFRVLDNPRRLSLDQFWAEEYVFWDHAGETLKLSSADKLKQAQVYLSGAEKVSVDDKIIGYRIVVPDVLPRSETFWVAMDKVFNLGYSAYEEKSKYAQGILESFKLR